MKKLFQLTSMLILSVILMVGIAAHSYMAEKQMPASEVKSRWGDKKADLKKFKDAAYDDKASMAYSIMTDKSLIGKSYEEIRELFGENDGYYFSDTIPTYIIQRGKKNTDETWQLVFRLDKNYNVKEIFIHKNCCDK